VPDEKLRPGSSVGAYPERRDDDDGSVERLMQRLHRDWTAWRAGRPATLQRFATKVEDASSHLAHESDDALRRRTRELRRRLSCAGLRDALLVETFALVRELARRTLGTPHYDVQLMGGWIMTRGMLAEMATGEGKTLTTTLPACAAALAGIPVHVISANDYLVERDAELMRPLYRALGLSVGAALERDKDAANRRAAYACDITYATAKTVAFDYLRDRLAVGRARSGLDANVGRLHGESDDALLLRGLCFAIVDEADSVLIDEARTPLILSGTGGGQDHLRIYRRAQRLARSLEEGLHFCLERRDRKAMLLEAGHKRLEELCAPFGGLWTGPRRREEWVLRALTADHLFLRDRDYIVRDGRVEIVDALTGRTAPDRSWDQGLHQLVEMKEGCELSPELETRARISYQRFFRRYLRLAGTTGTAREVAGELSSVYRLGTARIATRLPIARRDLGVRMYSRADARARAVLERVRELRAEGRPVLVGTSSVAASEELGALLEAEGLDYTVLNARQDAEEAAIVAQAGQPGRITVATHMAGRGTDIHLGPGVVERGGLHVIATQRGEARRIDRQLFGRSARQGDPGSCEAILALEDEAVRVHYSPWLLRWLDRRFPLEAPGPRWLSNLLTSFPQWSEETRTARLRRELLQLEDSLGDLLAFAGPGE